jgi:histidinol dehydrogenase
VVAGIMADVRARGDAAVVDYTRKFDRIDVSRPPLRISDAERDAAPPSRCAAQREALTFAASASRPSIARLLPKDVDFTDAAGTRLGARYRPVEAVGSTCRAAPRPIRPRC